jgi:aminoglycoside/choline kinase family phosphotransferase
MLSPIVIPKPHLGTNNPESMPQRLQDLNAWLAGPVGLSGFEITPASGDASFRRYFRVSCNGQSYIAMDAPPDKEDSHPFVEIARRFREQGVNVPRIHAQDLAQGYLLLDDFGSTHYLDVLDKGSVELLYGDAIRALCRIQQHAPWDGLPPYDRPLLLREMELFREWLCQRQLGLTLTDAEQRMLDETFGRLADSAQEQPHVCVHRDYHSRNLMVTNDNNPGILDFQDAVFGPVTYDLVSLLRDCYIRWPIERVEAWAQDYLELALQSDILGDEHREPFPRWFDLMGVQRQLKAAGIFGRLNKRDGKPGYLKDIPRTLGYILDVAPRYPMLEGLAVLVRERVLPAMERQLEG